MEFRMLKDPLNTLCDVRGFKTFKFYWCGRSLERPTLSRCYVGSLVCVTSHHISAFNVAELANMQKASRRHFKLRQG